MKELPDAVFTRHLEPFTQRGFTLLAESASTGRRAYADANGSTVLEISAGQRAPVITLRSLWPDGTIVETASTRVGRAHHPRAHYHLRVVGGTSLKQLLWRVEVPGADEMIAVHTQHLTQFRQTSGSDPRSMSPEDAVWVDHRLQRLASFQQRPLLLFVPIAGVLAIVGAVHVIKRTDPETAEGIVLSGFFAAILVAGAVARLLMTRRDLPVNPPQGSGTNA